MDMLYSRYSNPFDLMKVYINQGRFGQFVSGFLQEEHKRKTEETEKEQEMYLWIAYIHSHSDVPYGEWKKRVCSPQSAVDEKTCGGDQSLDDEGIEAIINDLFPHLNS